LAPRPVDVKADRARLAGEAKLFFHAIDNPADPLLLRQALAGRQADID